MKGSEKMKAYLANSLYSESDLRYNAFLAAEMRIAITGLDLYNPQENLDINDKLSYADSKMIVNQDDGHLYSADFVIAVIDGPSDVDTGVACVIGVAATLEKPIFALYTDSRQLGRNNTNKLQALVKDSTENQFVYRNLYVIGKIKQSNGGIYSTLEDLVEAIGHHFGGF